MFEIVRFYQARPWDPEVVDTVDTEEEAQARCQDPETSSSTCTSTEGLARTEANGAWFEGYRRIV